MLIGYTTTIDAYRARTDAMQVYVLRAKKCPCSKSTTAKQLRQYGKCVGCVKEATLRARKAAA